MSSYVLSIRGKKDRSLSPEEQAVWHQWFESFGESITAFYRVGESRRLGAETGGMVLSSCVVVTAESLEAAERLASGCPGLAVGGVVEIGEVVGSDLPPAVAMGPPRCRRQSCRRPGRTAGVPGWRGKSGERQI